MRIAFASEEDKGVEGRLASHFGRCPYYVFVDVEDKQVKRVETKENPFFNRHESGVVPQFIANEGARVIITGAMGSKAIEWFKNLGVQPVTGVSGKIEDILGDYMAGKLSGAEPCNEERDYD